MHALAVQHTTAWPESSGPNDKARRPREGYYLQPMLRFVSNLSQGFVLSAMAYYGFSDYDTSYYNNGQYAYDDGYYSEGNHGDERNAATLVTHRASLCACVNPASVLSRQI